MIGNPAPCRRRGHAKWPEEKAGRGPESMPWTRLTQSSVDGALRLLDCGFTVANRP